MAASFPNAKKTFTQVVNGVTKLVAALFNPGYDEIEAIETFIGPLGCTSQAYTESIKNLLLYFRRNCDIYYSGVAEIKVKVGELAILDASGNARWRRNTSEVTVNWANLDTGSEANDTIYYVYAVADSAATTFTIVISTNATTPTGCTFYRQIGRFYNDSAGDIQEVSVENLNNFNIPKLGAWLSRSNNTSYEALTDGFVIGSTYVSAAGDQTATAIGYTDGSNPPTTIRGRDAGWKESSPSYACGALVAFRVRKGDYWKVSLGGSGTDYIFFIPTGA